MMIQVVLFSCYILGSWDEVILVVEIAGEHVLRTYGQL